MIGVVFVAHAPLGRALLDCASHVYGRQPEACRVIDIEPDADPALQLGAACTAVDAVDDGSGVLVLVDVFGATPGNVATGLARADRVEVLAGVNLAMVLKVLCYRESLDLASLAQKAAQGASAAIVRIDPIPTPQRQRFPAILNPCETLDDGDARPADQQ